MNVTENTKKFLTEGMTTGWWIKIIRDMKAIWNIRFTIII